MIDKNKIAPIIWQLCDDIYNQKMNLADGKKQICGTQIPKADGTYYIEAAHITPKAQKGPELPENILILCPNHHKDFDYGKPVIIERDKEHIRFKLNGKEYNISLKLE